ncbi:MAG: pseudaminic acid synthase [Planctomycetota bacterium]|jgi:N-acetylneuraminate synthase
MAGITIGGRRIGPGEPVYVIAEMSANHHQQYERAEQLVHAAHEAGADAIKLQTYTADTMTLDSEDAPFQIGPGTIWAGRSLHELYREAQMPWEWHEPLMKLARKLGVTMFSTPFDENAVDLLERLDVPAYKIASFELTHLPLIRHAARTGRPMILSTGMGTSEEIDEAVVTAREAGCNEVALLRCNSAYPAPPEEMHLRTIPDMAARYDVPVGLSDHTLGIAASVSAVALSACIIEKHFTLSRDEPGPDSAFSLEPDELRQMVTAVHQAQASLGEVRYGPTSTEKSSIPFRRSLFVVRPIKAGDAFTDQNVRIIRPGLGLPPRHLDDILGHPAVCDLAPGTPLRWEHVAGR